jgi:hypothetical protein
MPISEFHIAQVVAEASKRMRNPNYVTNRVDKFHKAQKNITQYVIAHQNELGVEGVVSVIFHASLILESVERATGRMPSPKSYQELDLAAKKCPRLDDLAKSEPDLASFILANMTIEKKEEATVVARRVLAHVAVALLD